MTPTIALSGACTTPTERAPAAGRPLECGGRRHNLERKDSYEERNQPYTVDS